MLIKVPRAWDIPDSLITPEHTYMNRRRFLTGAGRIGVGLFLGGALAEMLGCEDTLQARFGPGVASLPTAPNLAALLAPRNPKFQDAGRPLSDEQAAAAFNNYYEFGLTKRIAAAAQALPVRPWAVEVSGLIKNPKTYAFEDFAKLFPLEERVYKHRCVEAWSMTVPWIGFPQRLLLEAADPLPEAQFVQFTSYHNDQIALGPGFGNWPWPYTENLRLDEMANELAFFATGIYGHELPPQHGAPIRQVMPWKYGFKGAKSIVKIEFLATRGPTFWTTVAPHEYTLEANIDPAVPHPRWSQAEERVLDLGDETSWKRIPTLKYNGYGEYVAALYGG